MRRCDCEQCRLWSALQDDDRSLVDHAFSLLGTDGGYYEHYGDSYAGAGACYILRAGSKQHKNRLARLIRKDEGVRCRILGGLWGEYELSHKLIAKIFELSDYEQRFDHEGRLLVRFSSRRQHVDEYSYELSGVTCPPSPEREGGEGWDAWIPECVRSSYENWLLAFF